MIDIDKKIEKIEKNCVENAKKELKSLETENTKFSEEKILNRVNDYKEYLQSKYKKDLKELEKDFNKKIYDYEISAKQKVSDTRKEIVSDIKKEVYVDLNNFVNCEIYFDYLKKNIEDAMKMVKSQNVSIILTNRDYNKYKTQISTIYGKFVENSFQDFIGGAMIYDQDNNVLINNSIEEYLNENFEKKMIIE